MLPSTPGQAFERWRPPGCEQSGVYLFHGPSGSVRFSPSVSTYDEEIAQQAGLVWADLDFLERLDLTMTPFDRVHQKINEIAGSSVNLTFGLGTPVDPGLNLVDLLGEIQGNGKNEVVFSDGVDDEALARAYRVYYDVNCRILATDIVFNHGADNWRFLKPEDYGLPYQDTQAGNLPWVQTVYLHELLHALGLDHVPHEYTYLNAGRHLAWSKQDHGNASIPEPLPDERTALRSIYTTSVDPNEFDLLVTNTWFDDSPDAILDGAATQTLLCPPSKARQDLANPGQFSPIEPLSFDGCNPLTGNVVCPGQDSVAVAYTASNNGVVPEWVVHELWFSLDDQLDTSQDLQSPDEFYWIETLDAYQSSLNERFFRVPAGLTVGTEYYLIARVRRIGENLDHPNSQFRERSYRNNWIPLRGRVQAQCN